MTKSNKTETKWKTGGRISGSRIFLECVTFIVQRQKLTANKLNLSYLGKSHWEGLWIYSIHILNSFCIKPKLIWKITFVFTLQYAFLIFFNTARESDKSYMTNHVVYFGLKYRIAS